MHRRRGYWYMVRAKGIEDRASAKIQEKRDKYRLMSHSRAPITARGLFQELQNHTSYKKEFSMRVEKGCFLVLLCLTPFDSSADVRRGIPAFAVPPRHSERRKQLSDRFIVPPVCTGERWHSLASTPNGEEPIQPEDEESRQRKIRKKVRDLAHTFVVRPIVSTAPLPRAIASVLKDATLSAVDMAVDEVISRRKSTVSKEGSISSLSNVVAADYNVTVLVDEAFAPMEASLIDMEEALRRARESLEEAKELATEAIEAVQVAAIAQAAGAATAVAAAEEVASQEILSDIYDDPTGVDVSSLTYDDVGYHESEMQPPFLDPDQCLVPGEAVVRVEKAPENSRRIFAGIDIFASVDDVWKVMLHDLLFILPKL